MNERNKWATPKPFFDKLNDKFNFTLDVCASPENAKVPHFFTEHENGLKQDWRGYVCWMNPPYGRGLIEQWVEYATRNTHHGSGSNCTVVGLLPARTGSSWFHKWVLPYAQVYFVKGRVQFVPPPGVQKSSNPQDSVIAVWDSTKEHISLDDIGLVSPLCSNESCWNAY